MTTEDILSIFKEITTIPRESGNEKHIIAYLQDFAKKHNLQCKTDKAGNVLIIKEADKGKESVPTIILQSHSDMVCEKNAGVEHDFTKDPIKYVEEDGWLIAKDTTLGADCGIGMAAQLALLIDKSIKTGKLEALFTVSEETGMDGAFALEKGFFEGKYLINLDSEDEGELFIGCAGGIDTTAKFHYEQEPVMKEYSRYMFKICGAQGGHSGDDIDKGRANAIKILARFIYRALDKHSDIQLYRIDGGNKRNAIAREAWVELGIDGSHEKSLKNIFKEVIKESANEYHITDPNVTGTCTPLPNRSTAEHPYPKFAIDGNTAAALIYGLYGAPHGVLGMSAELKGLVETSTNLASVKMEKGNIIRIGTSQRSAINSCRKVAAEQVEAVFALAGAVVTHEGEYPGWQPNLDSQILKITKAAYEKLFDTEPVVRAIHAGLECGLFLKKFPELDMISFGPTLRGVHAPGEKLELASVDKFRKLLIEVVENIQ